jgi:hypothetical protein
LWFYDANSFIEIGFARRNVADFADHTDLIPMRLPSVWIDQIRALETIFLAVSQFEARPRFKVGKSETNWDDFRGLERDINVRCSEARADFSRAYNASPARNRVGLHMRLSHFAIHTRRQSMAAD